MQDGRVGHMAAGADGPDMTIRYRRDGDGAAPWPIPRGVFRAGGTRARAPGPSRGAVREPWTPVRRIT